MRFVDLARIEIRSGNGGDGAVSFRREKFVEFGGPDGGNGGRGGSIYVRAVDNLNTLIDFRYRKHIRAGHGKHGMGRNRSGRMGADVTIDVPAGTEILGEDGETLLHDLVETGHVVLLAEGGNGGFGNHHFRSSRNRAPRHANKGQPGIERQVWLRLKVLADVGLVGLPNAGKSTFLATVSNARPKIASYPFTTLQPNLGMVSVTGIEFVMADIPGLVRGAHEGKGIGDRFLGHVERCKIILHLVDLSDRDVVESYRVIRNEMRQYDQALLEKHVFLVGTKMDLVGDEVLRTSLSGLKSVSGMEPVAVSSLGGLGVHELAERIAGKVQAVREGETDKGTGEPWEP